MPERHLPVFPKEVIELLCKSSDGTYGDLTFGQGGHSESILMHGAKKVVGFDRDADAIRAYRDTGLLRSDARLVLIHSRFSRLRQYVKEGELDGVLLDLGVSTEQILGAERGFSFTNEGPLDMRMDRSDPQSLSAKLAHTNTEELAHVLADYGDIPHALALARKILELFRKGKLKTTADLAQVMGPRHGKRHPATTLFMALRLWVNEELEEVKAVIPQAVDCLKPGGRLVILSFHSGEDRVVKHALQRLAGKCVCDQMPCTCPKEKRVILVNKKPLIASREEQRANPRSRSAKLRCIEKIA